jgi:hypothetical protein
MPDRFPPLRLGPTIAISRVKRVLVVEDESLLAMELEQLL